MTAANRVSRLICVPIDGGTELVFTHAMLSSEESRKGHTEGWNGALDKLEKYLLSHEGAR